MARIKVSLDASGIEGFDPTKPVKVLVATGGKPLASERVKLDKNCQAQARLAIEGKACCVRVIIGPPDATDDEFLGLNTSGVDVPLRCWLATTSSFSRGRSASHRATGFGGCDGAAGPRSDRFR